MFLDKDYAALMEIGEIMRTRGGHLKYVLVSCRDGKFVSRCFRGVSVAAVPIPRRVSYVRACVCTCAAGCPKVQTPKFIATTTRHPENPPQYLFAKLREVHVIRIFAM